MKGGLPEDVARLVRLAHDDAQPPPGAKARVRRRLSFLSAAGIVAAATGPATAAAFPTAKALVVATLLALGGGGALVVARFAHNDSAQPPLRAAPAAVAKARVDDRPKPLPAAPARIDTPAPAAPPVRSPSAHHRVRTALAVESAREPSALSSLAVESAPEPSALSSRLKEESAFLLAARAFMKERRWSDARARLEAHRVAFPAGSLAEEREALSVRLLLDSGNEAAARDLARQFRTAYPHSIHLRTFGLLLGNP